MTHEAVTAFIVWYNSVPIHRDGFPAMGTIGGALWVLERLKENFDLDIKAHVAPGGTQIKEASGANLKRLLEGFGETRPFLPEGGRTNRGLVPGTASMLAVLNGMGLDALSEEDRNDILTDMQQFLVNKIDEYHSRQRFKVEYSPSKSTRQFITEFLAIADKSKKMGPVAQYLVGAKLQLRFPNEKIRNDSFSTADIQANLPGDFVIADTAYSDVKELCTYEISNQLIRIA